MKHIIYSAGVGKNRALRVGDFQRKVSLILLIALALVLPCSAALAEQIEIVGAVTSAQAPAAQPTPAISEADEVDMAMARASLKSEPMPQGRLEGLIIGIDPGHQAHANSDK